MTHSNPFLDLAGPDLAPMIAYAHTGEPRLQGSVEVRRGNLIARLLASLASLPKAGGKVPFWAAGTHLPDRVIWLRSFGGHRFKSQFHRAGEFLEERRGPIAILLQLEGGPAGISMRSIGTRLFGFTLPAWSGFRVDAHEREKDGKYEFSVDIRLPLIGRLISYGGTLDLQGWTNTRGTS